MDLVKIGKFIQECRKAKNLTQVQLALKIGVSEKTISKWECGNGFPDATLMLPLSKELGITTNELLSGKILSSDKEYKNLAETNLINLKQTQEKTSKFLLTLELLCQGLRYTKHLCRKHNKKILEYSLQLYLPYHFLCNEHNLLNLLVE